MLNICQTYLIGSPYCIKKGKRDLLVKGYSTFVGSPDVIPGIGRETIGCWPLLPDIF